MKNLRFVFLSMSFFMTGVAVWASLQSNLWLEGARLIREPWMAATLWDFYFNIAILGFWVFFREAKKITAFIWIVLFAFLGSIATAFYVFLCLNRVARGESVRKAFLGKAETA